MNQCGKSHPGSKHLQLPIIAPILTDQGRSVIILCGISEHSHLSKVEGPRMPPPPPALVGTGGIVYAGGDVLPLAKRDQVAERDRIRFITKYTIGEGSHFPPDSRLISGRGFTWGQLVIPVR